MQKSRALSLAFASLGIGIVIGGLNNRAAIAQLGGAVPAFVRVQATTPGTAQTGNSNVTGTAIAGQHVGGGAGLTGVNADKLDGIDSTSFLQSIPNPLILTGANFLTGTVKGTNTSTSAGSTGVWGESTAATGFVNGLRGDAVSTNGRGVYGTASGSQSSAGYFENTGNGTGLTVTARYNGIRAEAEQSGSSAMAIFGKSSSTSVDFPGYGVVGESNNERGSGVRGVNRSTAANGYFGAGGTFVSLNEGGVGAIGYGKTGMVGDGEEWGGRFWSSYDDMTGLFGFSYGFSGSGIGGEFGTNGPTGRAIFAKTYANSGQSYGGRFEVESGDARAVYALASATSASATPYGVRGQASTSTTGYGVYAVGDLGSSGVKTFRIDHPADPANKYLLHYSSESPFPQNFYSGNVTTNASGYAWVELPEYFQSINANFKYQLTVLGKTFAQAIVSEEIQGNRFQIHTNQPGIKVSWRIEADRNDMRIKVRRPKDVEDKTGVERGLYQHPEYYNQSASKGMDYDPKSRSNTNTAPSTRP